VALVAPPVPVDPGEMVGDAARPARQRPVERLLYAEPTTGRRSSGVGDNPFFVGQCRRVLARCGVVDPASIDEALALGAYRGLRRALFELEPEQIIAMVKRSGLRERGAQGFPVGLKWSLVAESPSEVRYVVANGEGGDPASGIDRLLLEGDPHGVIEGLVIAGFAVGASKGLAIIRSEHQAARVGFERAMAQASRRGFVGPTILGSSFEFSIEIHETAGASVGGEETALLNVLQGRRAVARPRPPFPSVSGLWQRPTLINSLETLANIPLIIAPTVGDKTDAAGTKIVNLSGTTKRPGLAEVALGTSIGEIIHTIGGGCRGDRRAMAAHIGGPAGATIGSDLFDTPFDYDPLRGLDLDLGSGGLVVLDESTCVVSFARYLVGLSARESCGTCPPCRIGTRVLLNLLDGVVSGRGNHSDLARIEKLCQHIRRTSMCELGRNAVNPLVSGLRYFRSEYEAHAQGLGCRAATCPTQSGADESA